MGPNAENMLGRLATEVPDEIDVMPFYVDTNNSHCITSLIIVSSHNLTHYVTSMISNNTDCAKLLVITCASKLRSCGTEALLSAIVNDHIFLSIEIANHH